MGKKAKGRVAKKAAPKKAAPKTAPAPSIQDVVVALIREHGKPMPFQTILANIKHRRLVKTKAKDFENVLRRTLSTSKSVKRVGRGVYGVRR